MDRIYSRWDHPSEWREKVMARKGSFANPASWVGPASRDTEPTVKGESTSSPVVPATERVSLSDSSILRIAQGVGKGDVNQKRSGPLPNLPKEVATYPTFRRLCDAIYNELGRVSAFMVDDKVSDQGSEVVAEIESLLEKLYSCPFGEGESLKRVVVAIQSQVNNAEWDNRHIH